MSPIDAKTNRKGKYLIMRAADYGINIGNMERGPLNKISDVPGVKVGHSTIDNELYHTGVTVVMPCEDDIFYNKMPAACFVQNGFGKTTGLIQIEELGVLESPIALTSTLNIGLVHDALVEYTSKVVRKHGGRLFTYNPIVAECNDAENSYSCDRPVKKENVFEAINNACADFEEGDIGAGKGTICHRLKGGIGSASRIVNVGDRRYTLGVMVQSNQGRLDDLTIDGVKIGHEIAEYNNSKPAKDIGSIIIIAATDAPLTDRQLKRVIKRATVGLTRVGSHLGHQSGDVYIGFSTANRIPEGAGAIRENLSAISESYIDGFFYAITEAVEEAVLNSMFAAKTLTGVSGRTYESINSYADIIKKHFVK